MFFPRIGLAAAFIAAGMSGAFAAVPAKTVWHPATEADLRQMMPPASVASIAPSPAADATPAQRAFVDPSNGDQAVSAPVGAVEETEGMRRAAADFRLRRTPQGFVYIDTSGYEQSELATLSASGEPMLNCSVSPAASAPAVAATTTSAAASTETGQ